MSLKHGILGLLNYGSMTGYDLDKVFKQSLAFFWSAQTTQIYRELTQMEKSDWVTSEIVIQRERPNKKVYSITEKGRQELKKWLEQFNVEKELTLKDAFLMRVFFAGELSPTQNIDLLSSYKQQAETSLKGMDRANQSIDYHQQTVSDREKSLYWQATALFGQYYFEACVKWADEVIKLLREETVDENPDS